MKINVGGKKGRGGPLLLHTIDNDMRAVNVCVEYAENGDEWRFITKVGQPQIVGRKAKEKK
jgi:hypothetical protein